MGTLGVAIILIAFSLIEDPLGLLRPAKRRSASDLWLEFGGLGAVVLVSMPVIVAVAGALLAGVVPLQRDAFSHLSWAVALPFCLLTEDFLQYAYHRAAHRFPHLWHLHRPHHTAESMGVFVSYRNGLFYYFCMPNFWWNGVLVYLGFSAPLAVGLVLKQIVVSSAHSPYCWDRWLYRQKFLAPFTWVLERVIVTPAKHHAHHGKSASDGISNPNGNFGNMFFIWDMLFGTAKINRSFPQVFGVDDGLKENWLTQLFWPLRFSAASRQGVLLQEKKTEP